METSGRLSIPSSTIVLPSLVESTPRITFPPYQTPNVILPTSAPYLGRQRRYESIVLPIVATLSLTTEGAVTLIGELEMSVYLSVGQQQIWSSTLDFKRYGSHSGGVKPSISVEEYFAVGSEQFQRPIPVEVGNVLELGVQGFYPGHQLNESIPTWQLTVGFNQRPYANPDGSEVQVGPGNGAMQYVEF